MPAGFSVIVVVLNTVEVDEDVLSAIQNHPGWVYVGAYVDEGITGTKEDRPKFIKLMEDCRAGKIDLIITKSVTRFARNTVVLLDSIRELKAMGIDVFFEKENIHTLSADPGPRKQR